jgi:UDP-N-acetylglucosamine acyltransferase
LSACAVADFDRDEIHTIRQAYRLLFSDEGTLAERVEDVANMFTESPGVQRIIDFIRSRSDRALCLPHASD